MTGLTINANTSLSQIRQFMRENPGEIRARREDDGEVTLYKKEGFHNPFAGAEKLEARARKQELAKHTLTAALTDRLGARAAGEILTTFRNNNVVQGADVLRGMDSTMNSKKGNNVELDVALHVPQLHDAFAVFLQGEYAKENIDFHDSFVSLKSMVADGRTDAEVRGAARDVFSKYIPADSASCLNLSHAARTAVVNSFPGWDQMSGNQIVESLQNSNDEIVNLMNKDSFNRFKLTPEYKNLKVELYGTE